MTLSTPMKLLGALTPLMLAVSPALAHAATTPASSRTEQTITRFYDHADRFTVRQGFDRIESQRKTLRPFYETFETESHDGTLGLPINVVDASIYEGVETYAQQPLIEQEEAAARQLEGSTSQSAHHNAELLTTFFADELDASQSLHARYGLIQWEKNRFFDGVPTGIDRLNGFVGDHRDFLSENVDGGDPFRSVEPTLSGEERIVIALQARCLSQTTDGLAILTSQIARGWEGKE
jgi:hypothetical protein